MFAAVVDVGVAFCLEVLVTPGAEPEPESHDPSRKTCSGSKATGQASGVSLGSDETSGIGSSVSNKARSHGQGKAHGREASLVCGLFTLLAMRHQCKFEVGDEATRLQFFSKSTPDPCLCSCAPNERLASEGLCFGFIENTMFSSEKKKCSRKARCFSQGTTIFQVLEALGRC